MFELFLEMIRKKFGIEPDDLKKQFADAQLLINTFDARLIVLSLAINRIQTKLDMLLSIDQIDVAKINREMDEAERLVVEKFYCGKNEAGRQFAERRAEIAPTVKDSGHA